MGRQGEGLAVCPPTTVARVTTKCKASSYGMSTPTSWKLCLHHPARYHKVQSVVVWHVYANLLEALPPPPSVPSTPAKGGRRTTAERGGERKQEARAEDWRCAPAPSQALWRQSRARRGRACAPRGARATPT
eukprot:110717-Chlamydomonas_euryale.AAC.3